MEKFRVYGGQSRLSGTVTISGAKNAALNRWVRILKAFALPSKCVISSQNSDETIDFIF